MLNSTIATGLELNVFVFLAALFVYFKQYVAEQPIKQASNDDLTVKPLSRSKLTKRKDLQQGVLPSSKPPSAYLPLSGSRERLTHTVSDSSLCARHVSTSNSASSVSLIEFSKDPNEKSKYNMGVVKGASKQQITASSESLNTAKFEMHTSLRIKRPPSERMTKECFVNKEATSKPVLLCDSDSTNKAADLSASNSENKSLDDQQDESTPLVSGSHSSNNQQLQSTVVVADHTNYHWESSDGVTLKSDNVNNDEKPISTDVQDVSMVSYYMYKYRILGFFHG